MWPSSGNAFPIRTEAGLALFDTGAKQTAPALHTAVHRFSADPLRYAVYSHGHIDPAAACRWSEPTDRKSVV